MRVEKAKIGIESKLSDMDQDEVEKLVKGSILRTAGAFNALIGGGLSYLGYSVMIPSTAENFQSGDLVNCLMAGVGILYTAGSTLLALDGLYDLYRGKTHHELFGTILMHRRYNEKIDSDGL